MLQGEHSAILSTFIQLPFVIKIFVLSIFEWPFYTGFTVQYYDSWLFVQVLIHRRDTEDLRLEVEDIERANLEIMADLFECKIEDLKISR